MPVPLDLGKVPLPVLRLDFLISRRLRARPEITAHERPFFVHVQDGAEGGIS